MPTITIPGHAGAQVYLDNVERVEYDDDIDEQSPTRRLRVFGVDGVVLLELVLIIGPDDDPGRTVPQPSYSKERT